MLARIAKHTGLRPEDLWVRAKIVKTRLRFCSRECTRGRVAHPPHRSPASATEGALERSRHELYSTHESLQGQRQHL
jgi:hypothetical protein